MPIYEHYCHECDTITEKVCKIDERKQFVSCHKCGSHAERIISSSGGIQRDEPTWLESAVDNLVPDGAHKPESRTEFKRYLREHNVEQVG